MGYNIRWEDDGVFVEMRGKIDSREISHANNRLYTDDRYDRISFQVLDITGAEISISKDDLIEISALDSAASRWNNNLRMVFLTQNENTKDLFEKYYIKQMSSTNRKISAFLDKDDALAWLND